jgi:SAM-dependent methyltransferase
MVLLSKNVNKKPIKNGQAFIECGSVTKLPFENETMDIVTANETVQFWPDISECFSKIYRVLKKDGRFYIINRYPPEGSKWWKMAKLKNEKDFNNSFLKAGFTQIDLDLKTRNPMYTGMTILLFGFSIFSTNVLALFLPLFFMTIVRLIFIKREEQLMFETFGKEYLEYKKKVRRWI